MIERPTKAIIAVAGYGTRRLPVAKAVDKCMIPLLNRPVVDYVVQDLVKAGVTDVYFVVSGDARQLRDYYSRNIELEEYLRMHGKDDLITSITPPEHVRFHYVQQDHDDGRYGTAIPLWLVGQFINEDEYFYLMGGDQAFWQANGTSEASELCKVVQADSKAVGGVMAVMVSAEEVERYGVIRYDDQGYYQEIVEKPRRDQAPSLLNNANFFLLPGTIVECVDQFVVQHRTGEYHMTDVLNQFVSKGNCLAVYETSAAYLDCGTVESWVASNSFLLHSIGT